VQLKGCIITTAWQQLNSKHFLIWWLINFLQIYFIFARFFKFQKLSQKERSKESAKRREPPLKVGYSRISACAGLLFMWGHTSSICARSSLISGNNTRVVFIASQFNSLISEEVSKIFWAFLSDNPSITTYWGNMTSRKEYYASRDASKVYQSVSIVLFSSMESASISASICPWYTANPQASTKGFQEKESKKDWRLLPT
jgi:hypothetical protein